MTQRIVGLREALLGFTTAQGTQSQTHIKPLHRHIAMRLVCEGGFLPEEVTPRPPLCAGKGKGQAGWRLEYQPMAETGCAALLPHPLPGV
jgi:hypothetical protein